MRAMLLTGVILTVVSLGGCEGGHQVDGVPDDLSCITCHGGIESSAPPLALSGEVTTSAVGVGAHASHMRQGEIRSAVPCDSCHVVPAEIGAAGHVDPLPAEVVFGGLALLAPEAGSWDRTTATCANVYCHGVTLEGGSSTAPIWTRVDGSQARCSSCHGSPPGGIHPAADACHLCHSGTVADDGMILIAGGLHIDGKVDVDPMSCDSCHGGGGNPAPPVDVAGNTDSTARGVGAHAEHLADSSWHRTMLCTDCHQVPQATDDPGHIDTSLPAELSWAGLAVADGATPGLDPTDLTCAGTYCHGATLKTGPGANPAPTWTLVDGTQDACDSCHGLAPGGVHPAVPPDDCGGCHPFIGLVPLDPSTHIDGTVDLASMACDACHGGSGSAAPPVDLSGNVDTTAPGVGAHREHVTGSGWHRTVACSDCHLVPQAVGDAGHLDTPAPAELTWTGVAVADGAMPGYDPATSSCSDTYCHGTTLKTGPGTAPTPTWTQVGSGQGSCGACHGIAPGGVHPVVPPSECGPCHAFTGLSPIDPTTHINGVVEVQACGSCHGVPPATGAHLAHVGDLDALPWATYPGLLHTVDVRPGATTYLFDCGQCHPQDESRHANGVVDVEIAPGTAPAGKLKSLSDPAATYAGGICSGSYCHSSGQEIPLFVDSPDWSGTFAGPRCVACHDNPPAYASGGAATATANSHLQMAEDGYEFGHFAGLPGPWHSNYHGAAADAASPMTCQTCHYDTVDPLAVGPGGFYYLDTTGNYDLGGSLGYSCANCHDGTAGAPAQGVGGIQPVAHVDGVRGVVFDPRTSIPAGTPGLPAAPNTPTYPTWVTAAPTAVDRPPGSVVNGVTWSVDLSISGYDPTAKTCQNIGCHIKQSFGTGQAQYEPLEWGLTPVGWASCNTCHQN